MRLTKENKELVWITKKGNFKVIGKTDVFIYGGLCEVCFDPFLTLKNQQSKFCGYSCSNSGKYNPFYGKKHDLKTKNIIGISNTSKLNHNYKGGVKKLNIPLYDTYASQLKQFGFEDVRIYMLLVDGIVYKSLQVRCNNSDCQKWFRPASSRVSHRVQVFNGTMAGQQNFYCSEECKLSCSVFHQHRYFKGQRDILRTYTQHELSVWAREVLKRYNFTCVCCGESATIGHHLKSKIEYPEFALDIDYGIALCEKCHLPIFHKGENHQSKFIDKCRYIHINNDKD